MGVSMVKGQKISLVKPGGGELTKVTMGLGCSSRTFHDLLPTVAAHFVTAVHGTLRRAGLGLLGVPGERVDPHGDGRAA